MKKAGELKK